MSNPLATPRASSPTRRGRTSSPTSTDPGVRLRSVLILLALALAGVASLLTADLNLGPIAEQAGIPLEQVRLLVLIQPAVLVLVATLVGWRTSRRTGLGLPILDGGLRRVTRAGLWTAFAVAVAGAAVLLAYSFLTTRVVPLEGADAISLSLLARLLYGGITEEVLLRWGLMGLLAWLGLRFLRAASSDRSADRSGDRSHRRTRILVVANVIAAVVFALGHFPAFALISGATAVHYALSFGANTVVGLLFGETFRRHGLEYAILAHAGTHLLAVAAIPLVAA